VGGAGGEFPGGSGVEVIVSALKERQPGLPRLQPPEDPGTGHVATIYKRLTEDGKVRYTAYIRMKGHPRQSQTFDRKADRHPMGQAARNRLR
jgi:hypothetical protein